jgi:hypothetical protein
MNRFLVFFYRLYCKNEFSYPNVQTNSNKMNGKLMFYFFQEELIKKQNIHHGISYQSSLFGFSRENLAF